MTYLEICNQVAFLSGTFPSLTSISTVVSQTGRKAQVVNWVNVEWQRLQRVKPNWRWMRSTFSGAVLAPTQTWNGSDFSLTRFRNWHYNPNPCEDSGFTCYLTATGVSDEQPLSYMPWEEFRRTFLRGTQTASRPGWFTVNDARQLVLGPAPDDDYTVKGEYVKSVQELSANSDEPELPEEYHWAIVWGALVHSAWNDEAVVPDRAWRLSLAAEMNMLYKTQLPRVERPDPLA